MHETVSDRGCIFPRVVVRLKTVVSLAFERGPCPEAATNAHYSGETLANRSFTGHTPTPPVMDDG